MLLVATRQLRGLGRNRTHDGGEAGPMRQFIPERVIYRCMVRDITVDLLPAAEIVSMPIPEPIRLGRGDEKEGAFAGSFL